MSLSLENSLTRSSVSSTSMPAISHDSQTAKPSQEVAQSMESVASVYKRYCEKNKPLSQVDFGNGFFATTTAKKSLLTIHNAREDGKVFLQASLHMYEHNFTISSVKLIGEKYYIVVHLELGRDANDYDVYRLDLKRQTLDLIFKDLSHPILTESHIISWASAPGTYSGYFRSYSLGGTKLCQVRISNIWDKIAVSASNGMIYVTSHYDRDHRSSPIVFNMYGKLISTQYPAVIERE